MTSAIRTYSTLARLYVDEDLHTGAKFELAQPQAHYLAKVMRMKAGANIRVFNGNDGEWLAKINEIGKRDAEISVVQQLRPAASAPDVWVLFAPVKKSRNDFIVEKATELGASRILPIMTKRTTMRHIKADRMRLQTIEAAEQTERMDIPKIEELSKLSDLLDEWDESRSLIFADEAGGGQRAIEAMKSVKAPCAILIGPEGGFDAAEREQLLALDYVIPISLGPRILRSDTAVAATLALWQAVNGDWN